MKSPVHTDSFRDTSKIQYLLAITEVETFEVNHYESPKRFGIQNVFKTVAALKA